MRFRPTTQKCPMNYWKMLREAPTFCPRGHRLIPSSGDCWTMRELEPGLFEYVIGPCDTLP